MKKKIDKKPVITIENMANYDTINSLQFKVGQESDIKLWVWEISCSPGTTGKLYKINDN